MDYLNEATLDINDDPYKYWKAAAETKELLTPLVRKYLSAPLSSVESERLFSIAGELIDDLRTRLSKDRVEMILFLHHNLGILNYDY